MLNRVFHIKGETFVQVSKPKAKKLFDTGETVYLIPCNASPHSPWINFCPIKRSDEDEYVHYYTKGA